MILLLSLTKFSDLYIYNYNIIFDIHNMNLYNYRNREITFDIYDIYYTNISHSNFILFLFYIFSWISYYSILLFLDIISWIFYHFFNYSHYLLFSENLLIFQRFSNQSRDNRDTYLHIHIIWIYIQSIFYNYKENPQKDNRNSQEYYIFIQIQK